jgi:hypothetical protein
VLQVIASQLVFDVLRALVQSLTEDRVDVFLAVVQCMRVLAPPSPPTSRMLQLLARRCAPTIRWR